jgi:uncharacterized protein YwqG
LVPDGRGRSQLGGVPAIPGEWPVSNGRALTHLASIALEELPAIPQRASLPGDGTLVFFADFSFENEGWGPVTADHPAIEIVHVPAGAASAQATPPDEQRDEREVPVVLNELRVRFEAVVNPREPEDLNLLQLNWDEELGFMFADAGQISFWAAPEDLRAGNWHRIMATTESC